MMAARTWDDVEAAIQKAVKDGILLDKRQVMPRGVSGGKQVEWSTVKVEDVLGCVIHQNGSRNTKDPIATARYHTMQGNHIGRNGKPLASTCYAIMIPDLPDPPWLTGDLSWRTWAQGAGEADHPGDENRHLKAVLVMGGYTGPGFKRSWTKDGPSKSQVDKLAAIVKWLMDVFGFGGEGVFGHYHFGKAACPGHALAKWVEECRDKDDQAAFLSDRGWQEALLRWSPGCLPKYGADGDWGSESTRALIAFQRSHNIRVTAQQDPFAQLLLLQRYPAPKTAATSLDVAPDAAAVFTSAAPTPTPIVPAFDTSDASPGAPQRAAEPEPPVEASEPSEALTEALRPPKKARTRKKVTKKRKG